MAIDAGKVPKAKFSNGVEMPLIGLGTWQSTGDTMKEAVKEAVKVGYRLIDTATLYGNEGAIGEALEELYAEGIVERSDIFITTKMFIHDMHVDKQEPSLRKSLALLRTDYVDLLLLHCPPITDDGLKLEDVWKGVEGLYEKGLCRAIGVSNLSLPQMERVRKIARIPIHSSQNEVHVLLPEHELLAYCRQHDISLTSYGSLGSPGRTNSNAFDWAEVPVSALENASVLEMARKYDKSPAQVLLRWLVQRGIAVIPKSSNAERIRQNLDILDFELTKEEVAKLGALEDRYRIFVFKEWSHHEEYPFKECPSARKANRSDGI